MCVYIYGIVNVLLYVYYMLGLTITSFFTIKLPDDATPLFIGDSNGEVFMTTYDTLKLDREDRSIIADAEKITGEIIASISGSANLLNGSLGLLIGYKNGVLLLYDKEYKLVHKYDIDKEIESIYLLDKTGNIIITTDDYGIFHFSIVGNQLINNWYYITNSAISAVFSDSREDSAIEFFSLSEDNGTVLCFSKEGNLILFGDPSFEGTAGEFYNQILLLASRDGDIAAFDIINKSQLEEQKGYLFNSYMALYESKTGNDFYEFFNTEFESDERVAYFKEFLIIKTILTHQFLNKWLP